jgi:syntaxin 16
MASRNRTPLFLRHRESLHGGAIGHSAGGGLNNSSNNIDLESGGRKNLLGKGSGPRAGRLSSDGGLLDDGESTQAHWLGLADECKALMIGIKHDLAALEKAHQAALKDIMMEEGESEASGLAEALSSKISASFKDCQQLIKRIDGVGESRRGGEGKDHAALRGNVVKQLATELSEKSRVFRRVQNDYLRRIRGGDSGALAVSKRAQGVGLVDFDQMEGAHPLADPGMTIQQHAQVDDLVSIVREREAEIMQVQKSVEELALVMRELMTLVLDQGTLLDRIDYNIECVRESTDKGLQELTKAKTSQEKSSFKMCVIALVSLIILMLVIIFFKSTRRN